MRYFLSIMCLLFVGSTVAQNRVLMGGIITNQLTGEPVAAAHVLNLTDSLATISSPEGLFKIPVHVGDSLVFSSIGYSHKALIIGEKEITAELIQVKMIQRDYQLGEVEVNPFGTKEQFRERFMELEVDDGTVQIIGIKAPPKDPRTIPVTEDANEIKKAKYLASPASFIYGNLSKDAKARQELHRLEAERDKHKYNYQKFNEKVVNHVTGYEGEKLLEFMDFCDFSEEQIYRFSDYELTVAILNKQRVFEQQKQHSDSK
ncbi:MAG: hypothetical protein H6601_11630 [Flavobacteriales bacterium]|nr:hypothetical protein [Flavobacteriales bacterium]